MRKYFILAFIFLIFISCRGGGANPSNQVNIPIIEPTPSDMYCQKQYDFVESYPQLDELRSNELTLDESGIEYFIFQEGNEEKPNLEYLVTAKYTGWLENGCVFDSSYTRNADSVFPLARVIQGWQIGLSKIGKDGKILIKIPPELGYGVQGAPPRIPGNSTLYFYVELSDIQTIENYLESQEKEDATSQ